MFDRILARFNPTDPFIEFDTTNAPPEVRNTIAMWRATGATPENSPVVREQIARWRLNRVSNERDRLLREVKEKDPAEIAKRAERLRLQRERADQLREQAKERQRAVEAERRKATRFPTDEDRRAAQLDELRAKAEARIVELREKLKQFETATP